MSALPKTSQAPLSPGTQAMYDSIMAQMENVEELTREAIITYQETIARYERQHRMTSATMLEKVRAGEIEETYEICCWSQDIETLDHILSSLD